MAPSSTTHLPPVWFLLALLWPVLVLMCQPVSVLPSKMLTKPLSSNFSGCGRSSLGSQLAIVTASATTRTVKPRLSRENRLIGSSPYHRHPRGLGPPERWHVVSQPRRGARPRWG